MSDERVKEMVEELEKIPNLDEKAIQEFKDAMKLDIGNDEINRERQENIAKHFEGQQYDSTAAVRWIQEYQEAVASVPKFDDTDK